MYYLLLYESYNGMFRGYTCLLSVIIAEQGLIPSWESFLLNFKMRSGKLYHHTEQMT